MAPRKKANKNAPQAASPQDVFVAAGTQQPDVLEDGDDLSPYPEGQQNEFLTTQAIYPDDFVRVRGRKDAWKSQENLAFQVQLSCLENPEIFVKLDVEFPRNYPKVLPKIAILNAEPTDPKFRSQIDKSVKDVCRSHQGSECVYEVTAAIDEYLNRTAVSRAAKQTPFSLEEERAHTETAAQLEAQRKAEAIEKEQSEQRAKQEHQIALRLDSERKRRQEANSSRTEDMGSESLPRDVEPFRFDQSMTFKDLESERDVSFNEVFGTAVILRQHDKEILIVSPVIDSTKHRAPQFVLKHIYLNNNLAPEVRIRDTMREVEDLLEKSKHQRHENVVDLYGYQILDPQKNNGTWRLSILTEYAKKGNLAEQLDLSTTIGATTIQSWLQQLLNALAFFDQQRFVHPAVHSGNVLLFYSEGMWSVKLSDGYGTKLRDLVDMAQGKTVNAHNKSLFWTAREVRTDLSNRLSKTCIWDLGIVALRMAIGKKAITDFSSPFQCIKETVFSPEFERFLNDCFVEYPAQRKMAHEMLSSSFLFTQEPKVMDERVYPASSGKTTSNSRWASEWKDVEKLGKGGQGSVVKARKISDQGLYAVKILKAKNDQELEEIRTEVRVLSRLMHLTIVRYYDTWVEQEAPAEIDTTTTEETDTGSAWTPPKEETDSLAAPRPIVTQSLGWGSAARSSAVPNTGHDFMESRLRPSRRVATTDTDEEDSGDEGGNWLRPQSFSADDGDDAEYDNAWDQIEPKEPPSDSSLKHQYQIDQVLSRKTTLPQKSTLFIQMELCGKRTLNNLIWHEQLPSKPLEMWKIFRLVLDGLQYIHREGIIHRDLKPDNIFIDENNIPRIGDFGLATTRFAAGQHGEVGTYFYIAPELHQHREIDSGSKIDMYSLGIILFEMTFQMRTIGERSVVLSGLMEANHQLPVLFEQDRYRVQRSVILDLIDHDPNHRPEAVDLIARPDIPDPMDDAKLRRQVEIMLESEPETVFNKLFSRNNDEVLDRAWEHEAEDVDPESFLYNYVGDKIRSVFHRHGAVSTNRQGLFPKVDHYDRSFTVMGQNGLILQLPYDLTLPYARSIAEQNPRYAKSYCFGTIYRQQSHAGYEPRRIPEIDFDIVSHTREDLALREAEIIYVLDEILHEIPAAETRPHTILLNHVELLDLILRHCNVRIEDMGKVKKQLSTLYVKKTGWTQVASQLRSESNIGATVVSSLSDFLKTRGSPDAVRASLKKKLGNNYPEAVPLIDHLETVLEHLKTLGARSEVVIYPLSSNSEQLYRSGMVFQCLNNKTGFMVATGGRYDSLVRQYHHKHDSEPPHAVGLRLNPTDIVNYVQKDLDASTTKATRRAAVVPPRCDVVVASFDSAALSTSCIECVKALWGVGLSAEVSDAVTNMEELVEKYSEEQGTWFVIVKGGGALKDDKLLKVIAPGRDEYEKLFGELAGWIKVEIQRKRK